MRLKRVALILILVVLAIPVLAQDRVKAQPVDTDSYLEAVRADVRAQRVAAIVGLMNFNETESRLFWPVYRQYEAAMISLNDERLAVFKPLANKPEITDVEAQQLIDANMSFEAKQVAIKKQYLAEFRKAGLAPTMVAKFMELDHRIDLVIEMKLAAAVPPPGSTPQQIAVGQEN